MSHHPTPFQWRRREAVGAEGLSLLANWGLEHGAGWWVLKRHKGVSELYTERERSRELEGEKVEDERERRRQESLQSGLTHL